MPEDVEPIVSLPAPVRTDWNKYVAHVEKLGGDVDNAEYLKGFKKDNPDSKLEEKHIPQAISEIQSLKDGKPVGKMTPEQTAYLHSGMTPAYKANPKNLNYPVSPTHGTDLEKHLEANAGNIPPADGGKKPVAPVIPQPNYNDPTSRLNYAKQFAQKYGIQGRGDTPLRLNETPDEGTDTAKNLTIKAAKPLGLDPSLLYSSAMEEGMSGLFKDKNGYSDYSGFKDYPTAGFRSFGIDDFQDKVPTLIKKGYLPANFKEQYTPRTHTNERGRLVYSADFKSPDVALQAKAALVKDFQDQTESYAKKSGIPLSEKAKQFFTLVAYNGGPGTMQKMLKEYKERGLLEGDKYLDAKPNNPNLQAAHKNTLVRLKMADALKKEGLF